MVQLHSRKLSIHDCEQTADTSNNMNRTQKQNLEWKEADTKKYTARKSTYTKFQSKVVYVLELKKGGILSWRQ